MWRDGGVRCAHRHPTFGLGDLMVLMIARGDRLDLMRDAPDALFGMVGFAALTATLRSAVGFDACRHGWSGNADAGVRGCPMSLAACCGHACHMSDYRRMWVPGGTYFFTVNLADRSRRLLVERVGALFKSVDAVRRDHPFEIVAWVVLPEHLHTIWTLPEEDLDFATRWMLIKQKFSRCVPPGERVSTSRVRKMERGIWQRRYWEHVIRDERGLRNRIDYIHFNPVKHGHVARVADWPHSSFHRFVREDVLPRIGAGNRR
jgi:putative transposase